METINERLQIIVNEKTNGNISKFERISNLRKDSLKSVLGAQKSKPSFDTLDAIFRILNRNEILWLVTGVAENETKEEVVIVDNNFLLDRLEKLAIENHELRKEISVLKNKPYKADNEFLTAAEPKKE